MAAATPPDIGKRATPTFDLNEIRVDGDTVLPQEQIEEVIYPYLGPGKTAADVEQARHALQEAYTKAGWVTVSVSGARWLDRAGGVIGMKVVERRVERLRVVGAKYFVPDAVRAGAPSVAPGKVPNINQITRDLVGLNQLPDRTVQPALKPGRATDTVDVDLDVTDKFPLHGTLEVEQPLQCGYPCGAPERASLSVRQFLPARRFRHHQLHGGTGGCAGRRNYESASYLFHIPDSRMSLLFHLSAFE